jgi:uncharacterized protein (TIGR03067 family)
MPDKIAAATKAADAWLKLIDDGKFADAWEKGASTAKERKNKDDFVKAYEKKAQDLGKIKSRVFEAGTAKGNVVSMGYKSSFEKASEVHEALMIRLDDDGEWRVLTHIATARAGATKPDHELIQGKWQAISGERDGGIVLKPEELKELTMTFAGENATVTQLGPKHSGSFTLDQTKNPKQITVTGDEKENFRGNFGIYSLDGDTLKICMGDARMGRPTEFSSKIGDKLYLSIVLKRAMAEKPSLPADPKP